MGEKDSMPGRYVITVSGGCVMVGVWVWATEEGGQGEIMEAGIGRFGRTAL